jgi:hypothetical protein
MTNTPARSCSAGDDHTGQDRGAIGAPPYLPPDAARGCVYGFDPESPWLRAALTRPPPRADTPLPADALLDDLRFLHRLLRRQYAAYPDLFQDRDFDPEAFFGRWADTIRRAGPTISCRTGLLEPLVALRRVRPDNHLTFPGLRAALADDPRITFHEFQAELPGGGAGPAGADPSGIPAGVRPATVRYAPLLRAGGEVVPALTLSAAGPAAALTVRCAGRDIRLVRRAPAPPPPRPLRVPAYAWRSVDDAAVITLRAFSGPATVREQLGRLPADYPEHARHPILLIDLRDNGGGSLEYVDRWIGRAKRGPWRTYPRQEVVGALWPCSWWNAVVERQIVEGTVDTPAARAERDAVRADWPAHPPAHPSVLDPGHREGRAERSYTGRVFVLVNRRSGSSGELAAVQLKLALGAVVLGERTAGVMQYGEARRFVLPRTGVVCQVPTKRFFFHEDVEAVGWPVDVYLERIDQDAAELVPHLDRISLRAGTPAPTATS